MNSRILASFLILSAAAAFSVPAEEPEACRPATRFTTAPWWTSRLAETRSRILKKKGACYDLVLVGDSITHRWEYKGNGASVYPKLQKKYKVLNLGNGGDRTQNVIWRLENNGELDDYTAKVFAIMIGVNNGDKDPEGTVAGVKKIVGMIRAKHPESKILLQAILPHGKNPRATVSEKTINPMLRAYAAESGCTWLDMNEKFLDEKGKIKPGLMMPDDLHPIAAGYELWLAEMCLVVDELLGRWRKPDENAVVLPEKYVRDPGAEFAIVFVTDLDAPTAAVRAFADDYQDAVLVCAKGADRDRLLADVCGRYRVSRFPRGRIDLTSADLARPDAKVSLANYIRWGRYQAETPCLTRYGARVYRARRGAGDPPALDLPAPWRLVDGDDGATGCDSRLYYFTIEADGASLPPPTVTIRWPGVGISSVDGARNVVQSADGLSLVPTASSGGANYLTMVNDGAIELALHHHVEGAQHGPYGGKVLPWKKIRASDNWRAALHAVFKTAGFASRSATEGAEIKLYGFDSNFPRRHVDHPEHFHVMLEWDNWKKNNVGHYVLDENGFIRGNNFLICGGITGGLKEGYHPQRLGETTEYIGPSGNPLFSIEMLSGGRGLVVRSPGSPIEVVAKPGRAGAPRPPRTARGAVPTECALGFATGSIEWRVSSEAPADAVAISCRQNSAAGWQELASVSVTDDTEAGKMDFVFRKTDGKNLNREYVCYARDTGRILRSSRFDFALFDRVGMAR